MESTTDLVALSLLGWRGGGRGAISCWLGDPSGAGASGAASGSLSAVVARIPGLRVAPADIDDALDRAKALARRRDLHERVVCWNDAQYPGLLRAIPDPPPVLWVRGETGVLERPTVALVGSRACTHHARALAHDLGTDLAHRGGTVVSGLARRVDGAAHRGALD